MKLKYLLPLFLMLPLLASCNDEDNVEEIFCSGPWYVGNYFGKANWDKRNGVPKYQPTNPADKQTLETIAAFHIEFKPDGSFSGSMKDATFEGDWSADGKERTVRLIFKGRPNTSNAYNREFIETLKEVIHYNGDTNYLMLGPEDKKSYIQFAHKR